MSEQRESVVVRRYCLSRYLHPKLRHTLNLKPWESGIMRVSAQSIDKKLRVRAIAGTRAILIALDMDDADRKGLKGFAMRYAEAGKRCNGSQE
jgi:hypothetical protein